MRDLATGMLGVYFFGEELCKNSAYLLSLNINEAIGKESDFAWAMSRYYDDTVACMGALQVFPVFLHS